MATEILEARVPAGRPTAGLGGPTDHGPKGRGDGGGDPRSGFDPAQFGLWAFLGTVTMMFIGFTSAYIVRRTGMDWRPLPAPALLFWRGRGAGAPPSTSPGYAAGWARPPSWPSSSRAGSSPPGA
jgi:hypothetical protein